MPLPNEHPEETAQNGELEEVTRSRTEAGRLTKPDRRRQNEALRRRIDETVKAADERISTRQTDLPGPAGAAAQRLGAFRIRHGIILLGLDVAAALGLFAFADAVLGDAPRAGDAAVGFGHPIPWLFALATPAIAAMTGAFRGRPRLPGADVSRVGRLAVATGTGAWIAAGAGGLLTGDVPLVQLAVVSAVFPLTALLGRRVVESVGAGPPERVVVLGTGYVACRSAELVRRAPEYEHVGHVDDDPLDRYNAEPVLGSLDELPDVLRHHRVDRVLVAFTPRRDRDLMAIVRACDQHGADVDIVPRLFEFTGLEPSVTTLGDLPVVHVRAQQSRVLARAAKRTFDIVVAGLLLLMLSPVLVAIALAIKLEDRGPVIYRQRRIGRTSRPFDILKFRSMVPDADRLDAEIRAQVASGETSIDEAVAAIKSERDPRVTRIGEFIRRTSLDELPQLWNVVRGDMSLIGPRPLRPFEVEALDAWALVRQRVRPGITGLWQVLGRSRIGWHERMNLDYAYVRHWSPTADLRILAETVPVVLQREGAR